MPKGLPGQRRVRLGYALRDARVRAGLSQTQAGKIIGSSQAKISFLEKAQVGFIKPDELDDLMEAYGIREPRLTELQGWAASPYNGVRVWGDLDPAGAWWQQHQEVEAMASVILAFHLQAVDGLLQSPLYMRRQFERSDPIEVEPRMAGRLGRQRAFFALDDPPDCVFILDEACLHKTMGDPDVPREQIRHLLTLSTLPQVTIQILPFDAACSAVTYGFSLLQFPPQAGIKDFVSIDYDVGSATVEGADGLRSFTRRWELIRSAALSEKASRTHMRRHLGELDKRAKG